MIAVRRLGAVDAAGYRAIRLAALQGAPDAFGSTYEVEVARPLAHYEQRIATSATFGAYAGARIVGIVSLHGNTGPRERHKGSLTGMYVEPSSRRLGVGFKLVQALIDHAPAQIEQITLTVVQGNDAAMSLYQRFGFTVYGIEPRALSTAGGYADEILMVKLLREQPF